MSLPADAQYCVDCILTDLRTSSPLRFHDPEYLCQLHGGKPCVDRTMPPRQRGRCEDGCIIVAPHLTARQYRETLIHELVHRLADTPRWEYLNYKINFIPYNRDEFLENVATSVGQTYLTLQESQ